MFLPALTDGASVRTLATTILTTAASEQKGNNPERAAHHLHWAQELLRAVKKHRPAPSDIELGDVAKPLKLKEAPISIIVAAQPEKSGLLDLDTGEPRYFASGYLTRIQSLELSSGTR